ncbi:MAG: hypothetical protein HY717_06955 [Planctomycetes bacterium]|nr:hypothetical protein [Planctomycetota bacterium]
MTLLPESKSSRRILTMHRYRKQYRGFSATMDKDFVVEFLFSLRPENVPESGPAGGPKSGPGSGPQENTGSGGGLEYFWCEVQMKADLAGHGAWAELSKEDRIKAMYCCAADTIRNSGGRIVRQIEMNWQPLQPYAEGPIWDLKKIDLRRPEPVAIEGEGIRPVVSDVR